MIRFFAAHPTAANLLMFLWHGYGDRESAFDQAGNLSRDQILYR